MSTFEIVIAIINVNIGGIAGFLPANQTTEVNLEAKEV